MILLDTHVLVWTVLNAPELGTNTKALIKEHEQHNTLLVSAFSFWEIEMLIQKERISLPISATVIRNRLLSQDIKEVAVNGKLGICACQLDLHGDPADRIIVATAIEQGATLVTADRKILSWQHPLQRHDAKS